MTYEEAIKWLDIELKQWESDCKSLHPTKDALRVAIKTLEMQKPKKPKFATKKEVYDPDRPFATIDVTTMICPCCNSKIMFRKTIKHCLECGQLLDWSDNE